MSKTISPAQAASRTGISRWTIVRALKSSEIKAHRNNRNHWQVDVKSLDDWCIARGAHIENAQDIAQADTVSIVRIAELEMETKMLKVQLDEIKQDRDAWREQSKQLSADRQGFWSGFFRRQK